MISFNGSNTGLYLGSTQIGQAYLGSTLVYQHAIPLADGEFRIRFSEPSFVPTNVSSLVSSSWRWSYDSTHGWWSLLVSKSDTWNSLFKDKFTTANLGSVRMSILGGKAKSGVTNASYLFQNCSAITSIGGLQNFNNFTSGSNFLFYNCSNVVSVEAFDLTNLSNIYGMFMGCSSLARMPNFDTSGINTLSYMFSGCSSLQEIQVYDFSAATNLLGVFKACSGITYLPVLSYAQNMKIGYLFQECRNVMSGALANYNAARTAGITDHYRTFTGCGADTVAGRAELAQIPNSWGGNGY